MLSSPNEPFFVSQKQAQPHQYPALARELARTSETPPEAVQPIVAADLKQSIQKELDTAKQSGAALLRRLEYENWLKAQVREIDPSPSFKEKVAATINSGLVGVGSVFSSKADTAGPAPAESILIPEKPSTFKFNDTDVNVHTLTPPHTSRIQANPKTLTGIFKQAKQAFVDLWRASPAIAQDQTNLPGLADVGADVGEVIIDSNIESLAAELNYNPVAITSYVRSRITYEPYFGGQKGSSGCLAQLLCNDVDTASLTIALLRASGIPARYKHSFVLVPVNQLKTMLGTDHVKTVYAALTNSGLSPKLVNTSIPVGTHIDDVDIESETQLALEWTWVEGYVEYDERGGNISFAADKDVVAGFVDDAGLRTYLAAFPKKQWLPIEPLLNRTITRTRNPIAVDSSSIDAKQFWLDYFQYQGTPGPITKFHDDVLGATGLDSSNPAYSSTVALTPNKNTYDILPPALPYGLVTSSDNNAGTTIITAPYSAWPDAWRQTVAVSLASQDGSQTFLDKTFFASEINNQSIYLRYNGATQTDADVIASYGGLASTPAPLVEIVPYLEFAGQLQSGATPVRIGDTLVLETKLTANGAIIHESQKFSIAGNEEGMFIAFSSVAADAYLDNVNESGLLAQGTAALARTYLRHLTANRDALSSALDYAANFQFMRAIVTQNRSLNVFGDYPATFDFSGLTMDAATDMNDYSRRDNYKNRRDYFRLLFGLEASRYEGQLFTDVAGLDGISTVSGLQYAYAHPETYTVHTIESANQSEIDGLNISSNVKAQIQAAVSAGATAVVPDKNITKGNFQGIL
ncbi:MAG: transglutaminase-like domain-containing protein, partial [bacterium]|nr:transglutaminase-like domain-containing protein [bacterium]